MNDQRDLLPSQLLHSQIFRDYERAFGEATGLPLTLTPVEDMQLTHHGRGHESPLCALFARHNKTCAACLRAQSDLVASARAGTRTVTCYAGLAESAIPLRVGDRLIGFLRTGEVMLKKSTPQHFTRLMRQMKAMGLKVSREEVRLALTRTRVLTAKQYESMLQLLGIFAAHLSIVANQAALASAAAEPQPVIRAREFISEHHAEALSLGVVAKAAHISTFYFCKQFKKATGFSFTQDPSRVRVEKAKQLLLNPSARVSEVAFDAGFQSLTHFNRVFRNVAGQSPTQYRSGLQKAA